MSSWYPGEIASSGPSPVCAPLGRSQVFFRKIFLDKWRQLNLVQRTEFGIVVGMVIQVSTYAPNACALAGHDLLTSDTGILSIDNSVALYLPYLSKISNFRHLGYAGQSFGMSTWTGMVSRPNALYIGRIALTWKYRRVPSILCATQHGRGYLPRTFCGRFAISTMFIIGGFRSQFA